MIVQNLFKFIHRVCENFDSKSQISNKSSVKSICARARFGAKNLFKFVPRNLEYFVFGLKKLIQILAKTIRDFCEDFCFKFQKLVLKFIRNGCIKFGRKAQILADKFLKFTRGFCEKICSKPQKFVQVIFKFTDSICENFDSKSQISNKSSVKFARNIYEDNRYKPKILPQNTFDQMQEKPKGDK